MIVSIDINIDQLENELSKRAFKHRSWYKEGVTTSYALKSLATSLSGAWIEQKTKRQGKEINLFNKECEYVIKASGSKAFYRPKDNKELYYFTYHALEFEKEQISKLRNDKSLLNLEYLNERFKQVEKLYNDILIKASDI